MAIHGTIFSFKKRTLESAFYSRVNQCITFGFPWKFDQHTCTHFIEEMTREKAIKIPFSPLSAKTQETREREREREQSKSINAYSLLLRFFELFHARDHFVIFV